MEEYSEKTIDLYQTNGIASFSFDIYDRTVAEILFCAEI